MKIRSALSEETVTATDWPMVHHYVEYIGATSEHIGEHILCSGNIIAPWSRTLCPSPLRFRVARSSLAFGMVMLIALAFDKSGL